MSEPIPPSTITLGFLQQEAHRTSAIYPSLVSFVTLFFKAKRLTLLIL